MPTRKALLIGAPGGYHSQYLPGVSVDLFTVRNFLLSANGGSWKPEEITVLHDPDKYTIYKHLQNASADYTITYFSGHGYEDTPGRKFLCLTDGEEFQDLLLFNESPKQLVILDSCRNIMPPRIAGPYLGEPSVARETEYERQLCRKLYDNLINIGAPGQLILHSTDRGYVSYDTESGGMFTQCLLSAAKNIPDSWPHSMLDISSTDKYVLPKMKQRAPQQVPTVTHRRGNVHLPFAISPSKLSTSINANKKKTNAALLVALGIVAVAALAANSD